ncbi:histidine permease [Pseudomassariella vexata]|uniref:Histidine permease n=1 Tax=Pseudomassariella vexata TaxID=1141098 RepID=A0A1Y2E9E5_9PEZI|nr:histidine permease [Pseudomassariella vexata]ORY68191.1 histidine permease [Pseudomassariella vexata]
MNFATEHQYGVDPGEDTKKVETPEKYDDNIHEGSVETHDNVDELKRHLGNRQIQLIAIGGSIGTALFVSIGGGLMAGGPGSLFIAYTLYSCLLGLVNNCIAEMVIYMPVSGSFVRMAGKWVDESFGFMAGWNFFLYEACLIPFEISALNLVLTFWRDDIPVGAVCAICIVLYGLFNVVAVKYYGEAEFWLSSGKLLLLVMLFCFTFVTMVGGNPQHDAFGFRYWSNPGSFAEYVTTGSLGRFEGFLGALFSAAFTIVGPEYLAMVAGETIRPRTYLKNGFKTMYWRFGAFFIGGALCVGIILPYNDPTLQNAGTGTANGSPYVIAMQNMGISVFPHITNALMVTSIFSAGNAYTYCAMRSLYGLSLEGQAPKIFSKCTKQGIPIYAFAMVMCFPFLSFLQVSNNTAQVVTWFANLTEAAQLIDYIVMAVTYICFHRALKAQGIDRDTLPYKGWFQPWCGYIGAGGMTIMVCIYGYTTFLPGWWDVGTFFSYYTMVFVAIITFTFWKVLKKTRFVSAAQADLVWDKPIIDAYENSITEPPTKFREELMIMIGMKKRKTHLGVE